MRTTRSHKLRLTICLALLFSLGATGVSAQHYVGVMGGWGGGSARFKPTKETGYEWGLYTGGLSYKFYSDTRYVGAIEIDLLFTQKGFNYDLSFQSDESYHRKINAVELPLIWQPHFYLFQRHARFFINLGIQVSYNISSTYSRVSKKNGVLESGKYPMQLNRDNNFGYGLLGGAGLAFLFGQQRRSEFSIEARYGFGYGDILRNGTKYKGNPERSPLDNINVLAGFYYRLGKEGIRSAPSHATEHRMEEEAARHTLRRINKLLKKGETPADTLLLKSLLPDSMPSGPIPIDSATIEAVRIYKKISAELPVKLPVVDPADKTATTAPGTKPAATPENGTKPAGDTGEKANTPGKQNAVSKQQPASEAEINTGSPAAAQPSIKSQSHE